MAEQPTAAMTDQPPNPRRRWKRWAALALVLVFGGGVWMVSGEGGSIRRAEGLRIGQTKADVEAVMGRPLFDVPLASSNGSTRTLWVYATPAEESFFQARLLVYSTLLRIGAQKSMTHPMHPVQVHFDRSGKVYSFRRGSKIVGP